MKKCANPSCPKLAHDGDLCNSHFRIKREGLPDAESVWVARRLASVERSGECILWTGRINNMGYGLVGAGRGGKNSGGMAVHRWFYERFVGPIPEGLMLDHLCRTPRCVNVKHLEPVTQQENDRRGLIARGYGPARTHCKNGHPLNSENARVRPGILFPSVRCQTCNTEAKRRQAGHSPRGSATHCKHGHEYTDANTYWWKNTRVCRACGAARKRNQKVGT